MATTEPLANYDALSFDCYGTLIDWEQGDRLGAGHRLGPVGMGEAGRPGMHRAGFAGSARRLDVSFDHNRRHVQPGWGAAPEPAADVSPHWEYPSLAAFAETCRTASAG